MRTCTILLSLALLATSAAAGRETVAQVEARAKAALPQCAFRLERPASERYRPSPKDAAQIVDTLIAMERLYPGTLQRLREVRVEPGVTPSGNQRYAVTYGRDASGRIALAWTMVFSSRLTWDDQGELPGVARHEFGHCLEYRLRLVNNAAVEAWVRQHHPLITEGRAQRHAAEERWADGIRNWHQGRRGVYEQDQQALIRSLLPKP
jgi:hypothetical protein